MEKVLEITSNDHIIMIDKLCKRILGHPEILGRIIKGFIKEAKDVFLEEIIDDDMLRIVAEVYVFKFYISL